MASNKSKYSPEHVSADVKTFISQSRNSLGRELEKDLSSDFNSILEFELRFRPYSNVWETDVGLEYFNLLKQYLDKKVEEGKYEYKYIESEVCRQGTTRRMLEKVDGETTISWYEKGSERKRGVVPRSSVYVDRKYPFLYSFAIEKEIDEPDEFNPKSSRFRKRHTYTLREGEAEAYRIDMGIIDMLDENNTIITKYEVEAEFINILDMGEVDNTVKRVDEVIKEIYPILYDTDNFFSLREYRDVVEFVNTSLHIPGINDIYSRPNPYMSSTKANWGEKWKIDIISSIVYKARDLKFRDLVNCGIVNHEYEVEHKFQNSLHIADENTTKKKVTDDENTTKKKVTEYYHALHKTDGVRKLCVFYNRNVWFIMEGEYNLVYRNYIDEEGDRVILDGEVIENDDKVGISKYSYYIFDMIYDYQEDLDGKYVQELEYIERLETAKDFAVSLNLDTYEKNDNLRSGLNKAITLLRKTTYTIKNATQFNIVMEEMLNPETLESLNYETDGIIFTPNYMPYSSGNDRREKLDKIRNEKSGKRLLTSYPDICKWKPKDKMSIDFAIKWVKETGDRAASPLQRALLTGDMDDLCSNDFIQAELSVSPTDRLVLMSGLGRGNLVEFTGDDKNSYNGEVDSDHPMTRNLPSGTVVEYVYDYDRKMLVPLRIRNDKKYPNSHRIAKEGWGLIHHPIEESTLKGQDLRLMRKYHNKIKTSLISDLGNGVNLLDIGSGRGGDVFKWKRNIGKVVAVEPNREHINELVRRIIVNEIQPEVYIIDRNNVESVLQAKNMGHKIIVVNTGGEDYELISHVVQTFFGQKADVATMMLSLSFFWRPEEGGGRSMLDGLVNTLHSSLKPDAKISFLTINGVAVQKLFSEVSVSGQASTLKRINLNNAILTKIDKNTITILIRDTIVGSGEEAQTEWLVMIKDLTARLRKYGFSKLGNFEIADKEAFLNKSEEMMTKLYMYGSYGRGSRANEQVRVNPNVIELTCSDARKRYQTSPAQDDFDAFGELNDLGDLHDFEDFSGVDADDVGEGTSGVGLGRPTSPLPEILSSAQVTQEALPRRLTLEQLIQSRQIIERGTNLEFQEVIVYPNVTMDDVRYDRAVDNEFENVLIPFDCQVCGNDYMFRITCFQDANAPYHALLKAISEQYMNLLLYTDKVNYINQILQEVNRVNVGNITDPAQKFAEVLMINIYIVRLTTTGIWPVRKYSHSGGSSVNVILYQEEELTKYELVAEIDDDFPEEVRTTFSNDNGTIMNIETLLYLTKLGRIIEQKINSLYGMGTQSDNYTSMLSELTTDITVETNAWTFIKTNELYMIQKYPDGYTELKTYMDTVYPHSV